TSPFTATFTFSEAVTGFSLSGLALTNGTAANFTTVNSSTYTADITPSGNGAVTVGTNASAASDAAGNLSAAGSRISRTFDNIAPTVTNVTSSTSNGTYATGASISIQITFSEAVNVTGTPQLALNSGGTASYTSGSGTSTLNFGYTVGAGESNAHLD